MEEVAWSDESRVLLHHVDGRVRRLPGQHMVMFCLEILGQTNKYNKAGALAVRSSAAEASFRDVERHLAGGKGA